MIKWVTLFLLVFSAGCVRNEKTSSPFFDEDAGMPIDVKLENSGFYSYGIDESTDPVFGEMMLLGMNLTYSLDDVNKQVWEGFKAMYNRNPSKDYYLIELSDERGVFFFASRGEDMRAFAEGSINETEWKDRNRETMAEFNARIEPLLDPNVALSHTF
ncbi:MAG: hypothetical protein ABH834_05890 [Candidatus Altiarchaeota archaeon]